jgi:hypothetical protein
LDPSIGRRRLRDVNTVKPRMRNWSARPSTREPRARPRSGRSSPAHQGQQTGDSFACTATHLGVSRDARIAGGAQQTLHLGLRRRLRTRRAHAAPPPTTSTLYCRSAIMSPSVPLLLLLLMLLGDAGMRHLDVLLATGTDDMSAMGTCTRAR